MEITILGLGLWVKRALGVQDLGSQVPRNLRLKSERLFNTSNLVLGECSQVEPRDSLLNSHNPVAMQKWE